MAKRPLTRKEELTRLICMDDGELLEQVPVPLGAQSFGQRDALFSGTLARRHVMLELLRLMSPRAVLDSARAPVTVTNFLRYVDAGLFAESRFFRSVTMDNQPDDSVKIEVIQVAISREASRRGFPPIPLDRLAW